MSAYATGPDLAFVLEFAPEDAVSDVTHLFQEYVTKGQCIRFTFATSSEGPTSVLINFGLQSALVIGPVDPEIDPDTGEFDEDDKRKIRMSTSIASLT